MEPSQEDLAQHLYERANQAYQQGNDTDAAAKRVSRSLSPAAQEILGMTFTEFQQRELRKVNLLNLRKQKSDGTSAHQFRAALCGAGTVRRCQAVVRTS